VSGRYRLLLVWAAGKARGFADRLGELRDRHAGARGDRSWEQLAAFEHAFETELDLVRADLLEFSEQVHREAPAMLPARAGTWFHDLAEFCAAYTGGPFRLLGIGWVANRCMELERQGVRGVRISLFPRQKFDDLGKWSEAELAVHLPDGTLEREPR
jgi:hypothetical protein